MSKTSPHPLLTDLPAFRPRSDNVTVIIETPKGNRNKFDYDPEANVFELKKTLPEGQMFPYDFGFIPSTLGEDGDPLDVLLLQDAPGVCGCLVTARLIGVIQAEQTEDGKTLRNDRLLAVAAHGREYEHVKQWQDLRPKMVDEIEQFFISYNQQAGKEFKPVGRGGPDDARKLIEQGQKKYRQQKSGT